VTPVVDTTKKAVDTAKSANVKKVKKAKKSVSADSTKAAVPVDSAKSAVPGTVPPTK
jgi:hypothetical protein